MSRQPFAERLTWYRDAGQPELVQLWKQTPTRWPAERPSYSRPDRTLACYLGRVLVSQTDAGTGLVQQSQEQLAVDVMSDQRTVGRAMRWLEHVGWLELVKKAVGPGRGGSASGVGRPAVYRITGLARHVELSTATAETGTPQGEHVSQKQVHQDTETGTPRAETGAPCDAPSSVLPSDSSSRAKVSEQAPSHRRPRRPEEEELEEALQAALLRMAQDAGAHSTPAFVKALRANHAPQITAAVAVVTDRWPHVPRSHHELRTYLVAKIRGETPSHGLYERLDQLNAEHHPPPELRAIS